MSCIFGDMTLAGADAQGIKTWTDGDSYSGQWHAGCKHGFGKYTWAGGNSYSGGWQNDNMHGHGTYVFDNGDSYTGAWDRDVKAGVGTYRWADGHSELRVFSDTASACPNSTVVPGECPTSGKKFVQSMSGFRCASAHRSNHSTPESNRYTPRANFVSRLPGLEFGSDTPP